jgi:hypothetical protein
MMMPSDTLFVVSAVVLVFCIFAAVVAWADLQTRPVTPGQSKKRRAF